MKLCSKIKILWKKGIRFAERLVQCLVFYKANVDMNKIKEIVDDRF